MKLIEELDRVVKGKKSHQTNNADKEKNFIEQIQKMFPRKKMQVILKILKLIEELDRVDKEKNHTKQTTVHKCRYEREKSQNATVSLFKNPQL